MRCNTLAHRRLLQNQPSGWYLLLYLLWCQLLIFLVTLRPDGCLACCLLFQWRLGGRSAGVVAEGRHTENTFHIFHMKKRLHLKRKLLWHLYPDIHGQKRAGTPVRNVLQLLTRSRQWSWILWHLVDVYFVVVTMNCHQMSAKAVWPWKWLSAFYASHIVLFGCLCCVRLFANGVVFLYTDDCSFCCKVGGLHWFLWSGKGFLVFTDTYNVFFFVSHCINITEVWPDVFLKNVFASEIFSTNHTHMRPAHVVMDNQMFIQVIVIFQFCLTMLAHKSLFVVSDHVPLQWSSFWKVFPTGNALKEFVTYVHVQMFRQSICVRESFVAEIASVRFLASVREWVTFQRVRWGQNLAALHTHVGDCFGRIHGRCYRFDWRFGFLFWFFTASFVIITFLLHSLQVHGVNYWREPSSNKQRKTTTQSTCLSNWMPRGRYCARLIWRPIGYKWYWIFGKNVRNTPTNTLKHAPEIDTYK